MTVAGQLYGGGVLGYRLLRNRSGKVHCPLPGVNCAATSPVITSGDSPPGVCCKLIAGGEEAGLRDKRIFCEVDFW